jgi:predicted DsbA family dithiol-disulfide isomerase
VRIEKLKQNFNVKTELVHFPLHPDTPVEGRSLQDLFGSGPDAIAEKQKQMAGLMAAEGLPYGTRTHTYNSRLAQELGKWADTQPGGEVYHDAMYKAYFVDAVNVHDTEVLLDVVEKLGLSRAEAQKVLSERTFKDAIDADWMKSRQYGVTGVPTFVAGGAGAVGCQPYEVLEQLMAHSKAQRR